jgi:hypothetical protein
MEAAAIVTASATVNRFLPNVFKFHRSQTFEIKNNLNYNLVFQGDLGQEIKGKVIACNIGPEIQTQ